MLIGVTVGFIIGILIHIWALSSYKKVLVMKAMDGTSECINGKFYTIHPESEQFERLTEKEIDKILDWHKNYTYTVGSYPENWNVIGKLNKKIGRG